MWTKNEEQILVKLYPNTDSIELVKLLNKQKGCIVRKANSMGLRKDKDYITSMKKRLNPKTFWSENELKYLIENYVSLSNFEISNKLSKSEKSICRKLSELNLRRSKSEKDSITAKFCKLNGRDLNYDFVKTQALKYNSKNEFYLYDSGSYNAAIKNGWIDDICSHMRTRRESLPQIILRDILEYILKSKCSFNDRRVIYPKEIDCYFEKYRLGFEYDGKYYHEDLDYEKIKICKEKNITLIIIDELNDCFRNYELNIKNQLINKLGLINNITHLNITQGYILNYDPIIRFSDVLYEDEVELVVGKNLSEIKKINLSLYKRIIKYNFDLTQLNIKDDRKKMKKFKSLEEYKNFLKQNYSSFVKASKIEHIYRNVKKYGIDISEIKEIWN